MTQPASPTSLELRVFRSTWGLEGPLPDALERVAAAGFDGIEVNVTPVVPMDRRWLRETVLASGMEVSPVVLGPHTRDAYRSEIEGAAAYGPRQITSHTGLDAWSDAEAVDFLGFALELERELGIPINHETHRSRILFTPWRTAEILRQLPDLRLTADYSHWVAVAERLLDDRADDMALANTRARHIHARVGFAEGPQVNDPRSPAHEAALAAHEAWWAAIIRERIDDGSARLTVTPEYGPPPYMPTTPFSETPVTDLWDVCLWGAARFRELFASVVAGASPAESGAR